MKKVLIGMSGGVDSSVSAILLKKQGYEVIGVTMVLFDSDEINDGCLSNTAAYDAKKICDQIGIEHHIINLKDTFKKHVIDNFIESYRTGRTPNPCIECNRYLKFGALVEIADKLGCDLISTGHYARIRDSKLVKSDALEKDQTYFLYGIKKNVLKRLIFPLENYKEKDEIRKIASENNLFVATKKDSQEICFIPNDNYTSYLENNLNNLPDSGNFVDRNGNVLGKHKGIIYYTIGQRKGLGISSKTPLYVIKIDTSKNEIVLGEKNELYRKELLASNVNLLVDKLPEDVFAKIRYRSKEVEAKVQLLENNTCKVLFKEPQRAITPGQSVVFYDGDICLGGGIIYD